MAAYLTAKQRAMRAHTVKKTFAIIGISLLAALIVTIIILSVLKPTTAIAWNGKDSGAESPVSVQIIRTDGYSFLGSTNRPLDTIELINNDNLTGADYDTFAAAYKKATRFSFSYGILDNVWFPSLKLTIDTTDDDKLPLEISSEDIIALKGSASKYLVVVKYLAHQSATVKGKTMSYDRVFFFVEDTNNQIETFQTYLVDSDKVNSPDLQEQQDYVTYEINAWANGSKMIDAIDGFKENYYKS